MQLIVGRIVRPHGIRGEVIVEVRTDEPEARFVPGRALATEAPARPGAATATNGPAVPGAGAASVSGGAPAVPGAGAASVSGGAPAVPGAGTASGGAASLEPEPGAVRWVVPPTLTIEVVRSHQGRLIIGFEGVADRSVAEELRGVLLCVDSADVAPPADPDEFLDHQLVGLSVVTPAGEPLGEVAAIDHAPASDLLVLRRPAGGTALVPFVKAIVPEVDLAAGRVVVDPPEGLLEL